MQETQDTTERLRDDAWSELIPADWDGAVGGYLQSGYEANAWTPTDWARFPKNRKLPIWVAGRSPVTEAQDCVKQLQMMHVPSGVPVVADMETRVDKYWLRKFGYTVVVQGGYRLWVYGSASTVFGNPAWHGYWVASYAGLGPFMYTHSEVRATQYQSGLYDSSTVKTYQYDNTPWWV